MALAMADDIRIILVKIADRYHNMLTIHHLERAKQKRIALETLHVYAPIANRLGMDQFFSKLQDLSFKAIYPMRYDLIAKAVDSARKKNSDYVDEITATFEHMLQESGISGTVEGRRKNLAGIYFKMSGKVTDASDPYAQLHEKQHKRVSFSNIMDVHGFRIITNSFDNCYLVLGQVHRIFKPYPNRFKDYIAIPKVNGYQSLHTTVMGTRGYPIEVQIRTNEMHNTAQTGIASHWQYKSKETADKNSVKPSYNLWQQNLVAMQSESKDSQEFLRNVQLDLFPNDVYVFSPNGDVFSLPKGATPVDFAYALHTDIGNSCVGCEINNEAMPLMTRMQTGQTIEIITRKGAKPNPQWRDFVVTAKALSGMGYYFRRLHQSDAVRLGKQLLDDALGHYGSSLIQLHNEDVDRFLEDDGYRTLNDLLERLGTGKLYPGGVAARLVQAVENQGDYQPEPLVISQDNISILTFSRCCQPVKQDAVTAMVKTDLGIAIHRNGCSNIRRFRKEAGNCLPATWDEESKIVLPVKLKIEITNNRNLIGSIADTIGALGSAIQSMESIDRDIYIEVILFTILVDSRYHLSSLLRHLRKLADIKHVSRP